MNTWADVSNSSAISAVMHDVLDRINSVFEQDQVELPERQYTAIGATAHDCEQLTVSFRQLYPGPPGAQSNAPQPCNTPRTIVLTIQLVRKLPVSTNRGTTPPSSESMNDNTSLRTKDAWLLLEAVMTANDDYLGGVIADVNITDPKGEYQAIVLNVTLGVP